MVKLAQQLIRSSNSIKHICCYSIVLMCYNGFGLGEGGEFNHKSLIE